MILYHVSYRPIPVFYPLIPKHRLDTENNKIPRICTAASIEDCIMAKAGQGEFLRLCLEADLPCVIYVYTFEIDKDDPNLILPEDLEQNYGVLDAVATLEHWICDDRQPIRSQVLRITDAAWTGPWLGSLKTKPAERKDMLFVDLAEKIQKQQHNIIEPDEVFPQVWDAVLQNVNARLNASHE